MVVKSLFARIPTSSNLPMLKRNRRSRLSKLPFSIPRSNSFLILARKLFPFLRRREFRLLLLRFAIELLLLFNRALKLLPKRAVHNPVFTVLDRPIGQEPFRYPGYPLIFAGV